MVYNVMYLGLHILRKASTENGAAFDLPSSKKYTGQLTMEYHSQNSYTNGACFKFASA
ncbi:hypothetical protein BN2497_3163 [Janthinobacterium sp. CG23_2]|nr:hypothetical protein BN2497_3163 [Janthinobacterium sp. CG23_2]CUU27979.1 hypothetical protein BN3177_3163 [Janthinobacterium sp. CG23_2]